jgi:hypothetical protein
MAIFQMRTMTQNTKNGHISFKSHQNVLIFVNYPPKVNFNDYKTQNYALSV